MLSPKELALKEKRHHYYIQRKDAINTHARLRYAKKRTDPEFYRKMLENNQVAYHKKGYSGNDVPPMSPEEEEAYFKKIVADIRAVHTLDKDRKKVNMDYNTMVSLFVE